MEFIKKEPLEIMDCTNPGDEDLLTSFNMNKTASDFLSNEWSSNPNDLLDGLFNDFFNDFIDNDNFNNDYDAALITKNEPQSNIQHQQQQHQQQQQQPQQQQQKQKHLLTTTNSVSPVPSSESEFHGFLDENTYKNFDIISEFVNYEHNEPRKSPASDSGMSSDNMEMDTSPDYEPFSPALSSPGPSVSERGGQNSPQRCISIQMKQPIVTIKPAATVKAATATSQPLQSKSIPAVIVNKASTIAPQPIIVGKVKPMVKMVQNGPLKTKQNILQKKGVKIIKMAPGTQITTTTAASVGNNGPNKKVTIQLPSHDSQPKIMKTTQSGGTIILNKANMTNVPEVRKLIRVQQNNASNPRSILLPVSFQDVKDLRTIKIINASNLSNKSPNIKLAAANLLQQSKQGLVQKNVLVPKEKLLDDSMSDYTSDAESNVFEDIMLQHTPDGLIATTTTAIAAAAADVSVANNDVDYDDDDDDDIERDGHSDSSDSLLHERSSSGPYPKLVLTNEEKRLLAKEGIILPGNYPLTKHEERELKRIRRKIRNKISAQDSRKRKKEYVDGLEERVKQCTDENQTLMKRIKLLQNQNQNLMNQMKKLQAMLTKGTNKTAQPATCLMVLLLSLALVTVPNLNIGQNAKEAELENAMQEMAAASTQTAAQNRRSLLFNNKEQLSDAIVDEELNMDDLIAFNELNEQEIFGDGGLENNVTPSKKSKTTLIDFDVDDTNWRSSKHKQSAATAAFNSKAADYQNYLKMSTGNMGNGRQDYGDSIIATVQHSKFKTNNNNFGLNNDVLNLLTQQQQQQQQQQGGDFFGLNFDEAVTLVTKKKKLLIDSINEQRDKLNASKLHVTDDRKILMKGV